MPVAPIVEQKTTLNPLGNNGQLQKVANPYVEQTTALSDVAAKIAEKAKAEGDQTRLVEAQRYMDDWQHQKLFSPETGAFARKGKDAFNLPEEIGSQYDKDMGAYAKQLANQEQIDAFNKMATSVRGGMIQSLDTHARGQMDQFADTELAATRDSSRDLAVAYRNDDKMFQTKLANSNDAIILKAHRDGLDPNDESVKKAISDNVSKAHFDALEQFADEHPKQAVDFYKKNVGKFTNADDAARALKIMQPVQRKIEATDAANKALSAAQPPQSQDDIIKFTMNDVEGGDKVITDSDGGTAKFGINSKGNGLTPDQVSSLTPDEAAAIYKRDYWDKAKIGDLPQNMQAIAFDLVVNSGVDAQSLKMIKDADGDPQKLLELRAQKYAELAKDPENAKNYDGWMNRLSKISGVISAQAGDIPDDYTVFKKIDDSTADIETATDAKTLAKATLAARREAQKQGWTTASDDAWSQLNAGREVAPSVIARMNPKDVADMKKNEPDPALYEVLRQAVSSGESVKLADYRWRLGGKYNDLLELQNNPEKRSNARKVDDVIQSGIGVLIGRSTPNSSQDFARVDQFRRQVDDEIKAQQQKTGKTLGAEDIEKIVDRKLLQVKAKGADDYSTHSRRIFELPTDEKVVEVPGIPTGRVYYVADKPVSYDFLSTQITDYLQAKRLPLSEDNINMVYKSLVQKGKIVEKDQ